MWCCSRGLESRGLESHCGNKMRIGMDGLFGMLVEIWVFCLVADRIVGNKMRCLVFGNI